MSGVAGRLGTPQGIIVINASRLRTNGASSSSAARLDVTLPLGCTAVLQLSEVLLRRLGVAMSPLSPAETTQASRLQWLQGLEVRSLRPEDSNQVLNARVTTPHDSPLLEERVGHISVGRAQALTVELGGAEVRREYSLSVSPRPSTMQHSEAGAGWLTSSAWQQEESPFPPPSWPGQFIGTDSETRGEWIGTYGKEGYVLFGFDPPPVVPNQFCASENNMNTMHIACVEPAATIIAIEFASYGTPTGKCPSFSVGKCNAANSTAVVNQACVGKHS